MNCSKLGRVGAGLLASAVLAGCGGDESPTTTPTPRPLGFAKEPYIGIACGKFNSISSATACDRVGLAAWPKHPAKRVTASIAGRALTLSDTGEFGERLGYWEAYLHPAGLDHGALRLPRGDGDYWAGEPPVSTSVRIKAWYDNGRTASARRRLRLYPGYG
jgi:hypothetical protein